MFQFTEEEIKQIRGRVPKYPKAVEQLRREVQEVYETDLMIPEEGIGNWEMYYYCPDCSIHLSYKRSEPQKHVCPHCGKTFTGEPYDSSWWGYTNIFNVTATYKMAQLWLLTGNSSYADKAMAILSGYARYYKGYEVHGDIPYNGPGKMMAQTLDEGRLLRSLAMTYDLLSDYMEEDTKKMLREEMFLPAADFLVEHRSNQLHNHEVIINSAIAVIGVLFDRKDYIRVGLYEKYGLLYQLEHGVKQNNMWFEGSFGYHYFALLSFMAYEKFAIHTEYSLIHHRNYKEMMELIYNYYEPDYKVPMLNDTNYGHVSYFTVLYEFAYRQIGGDRLASILGRIYQEESRDNLEALLYGVDELPVASLELKNYHAPVGTSGHTILRGTNGRYLLFKHDAFGGEHDHYDRLDLSYLAYGKAIARDIGTTGYGAFLHYNYYKNTGSHNTVCIGEENQAPVDSILTRYEETPDFIYVEAEADWTKPYEMLDSYTIVQWSEEAYRPVKMKRMVAWGADYFAEVMVVQGANLKDPVDWVMHFSGEGLSRVQGETVKVFSEKKPYRHLHSVKKLSVSCDSKSDRDGKKHSYMLQYQDEDVQTRIYGMLWGQDIFLGKGPDNPPTGDINYVIERSYGDKVVFAHVIESYQKDSVIEEIGFSLDQNELVITVVQKDQESKKICFADLDIEHREIRLQ